jgi:hypothetical protein
VLIEFSLCLGLLKTFENPRNSISFQGLALEQFKS